MEEGVQSWNHQMTVLFPALKVVLYPVVEPVEAQVVVAPLHMIVAAVGFAAGLRTVTYPVVVQVGEEAFAGAWASDSVQAEVGALEAQYLVHQEAEEVNHLASVLTRLEGLIPEVQVVAVFVEAAVDLVFLEVEAHEAVVLLQEVLEGRPEEVALGEVAHLVPWDHT